MRKILIIGLLGLFGPVVAMDLIEQNDTFKKIIIQAVQSEVRARSLEDYYAWSKKTNVDNVWYDHNSTTIGQWLDENLYNPEYKGIRIVYAIVAPYRNRLKKEIAALRMVEWYINEEFPLQYIKELVEKTPTLELRSLDWLICLDLLISQEYQDENKNKRVRLLRDYFSNRGILGEVSEAHSVRSRMLLFLGFSLSCLIIYHLYQKSTKAQNDRPIINF